IEDAARFTERRQTISNMYVAVNSLLLAAIGLLIKDLGARGVWTLLLPLPLVIAGIAVCLWWAQLIRKYKLLVGLRIDTLRQMEESPQMAQSVKIFRAEDDLYPRDEEGQMIPGQGLNFSDLEARLPQLFLWLYALLGAGLLGVLGLNLLRWIIRVLT
ncbi:MAG: hypothetical protein H8D78_19785, partial [Chloroflexi bacterium]|nr:hypothetical protein [Chloroflexota bacterium]